VSRVAKRRKGKTAKTESVTDADIEKTKAAIEERLAALAPAMRDMVRRFEQQRAEYQRSSAALDRALRVQERRRKKPARVGRPAEYDIAGIRAAANNYIATYGVPRTLSLLCEKVKDRLTELDILIPGDTRLKELLSPIWKRAKRDNTPVA
jgi:hypothetical protein